jgi:hypothetical protein
MGSGSGCGNHSTSLLFLSAWGPILVLVWVTIFEVVLIIGFHLVIMIFIKAFMSFFILLTTYWLYFWRQSFS